MPRKAVGRAAVELPWLCPNTDSLIALADAPATVPGLSAADPGLALFLFRFAQFATEPAPFDLAPGAALAASLPDTAAAYLAACPGGVIPRTCSTQARVAQVTDRAARTAVRLAQVTRVAPESAVAAAARLAPLGWYAVSAVDAFDAAEPLRDPGFAERPAEVQADLWGLDHASITRRLAARWRLPLWLATTVGCLTLPLRVAAHLVSHCDVFAIVQLAVLEAEGQGAGLGLTHGADRTELLDHLRLDDHALRQVLATLPAAPPAVPASALPADPHNVPLLPNLLRLAAESRRRNGPALVARLEERVDQLHGVAADLGDQVGDRLREAKLVALAELAAGAGHEINNPLAIISTHAQRLLRTEPDPERGDALRSVVRQTQRISGILRDLMQFARPGRPERRPVTVGELFEGVRTSVAPLAGERNVRIEIDSRAAEVQLDGDPVQLRHALTAVVRNAVEAAGDGWVRLACDAPEDGEFARIRVEDSGPGLTPEVAAHAFDPFFSGRSAGRGCGLGLSTAWQFLRQNGGELRHDTPPNGPTRFTLTVRRADNRDVLTLRSA
ncbi:histidine kinase : ATP-binding region ATPase domain protein OS=Planctomyces limnophilus (strain ATCC 43296 / DSM 3776 / IFAM 1008 / 290) GN=Plim_2545 PE=4 SV=1: HisKA: HATPase_c [Gemmataceae bacterium]|nr:histidine kinase : ATP-binding region ATPase domain protein OS=Planctomyces limnophilus (strain ATCC 43296 / DSM 3776 / IFAM 1008 / 290) GN=Plim_2545 PE=4 SV=1: HisKA: HATPase_c [Gemmataceae bacterium]VTT98349.1 histidine kinase : ATP-binding region ATPase domain protein OS=Planctomyces limnophilus (strain ATCC 43296 / DSM 3776 / IFAM 1008 / 290) GN=Plim_2545 PE=4 SV=1: HisKA: HATPase_c [Gemmataceae bacterium]